MIPERLELRLHGRTLGLLTGERGGLAFAWDDLWLEDHRAGRGGPALSLSLPASRTGHDPEPVDAFLAGLLPDSDPHLARIAAIFGIPPGLVSPLSLLAAIGADCAGAVSFHDPDADPGRSEPPGLLQLSGADMARMLEDLPGRQPLAADPEAGIRSALAGANAKAAVVLLPGGGLALPTNGASSSHMLKIDIPGLPDSSRTEHFCLRLAAACGLPAPRSEIRLSGDTPYLLIARYDRRLRPGPEGRPRLERIHQEDLCQALGVRPRRKYEARFGGGGPGWRELAAVLSGSADPAADLARLFDSAAFHWLSGNPDAHGKNYALVYAPDGRFRLSPLYDPNNQAAFADRFKQARPLMAMAIGGEFLRTQVTRAHWAELAAEMGLPEVGVPEMGALERLERMARRIGPAAERLRAEMRGGPADTPLLDLVVEDVRSFARGFLES